MTAPSSDSKPTTVPKPAAVAAPSSQSAAGIKTDPNTAAPAGSSPVNKIFGPVKKLLDRA